jgi:hypothetical protein
MFAIYNSCLEHSSVNRPDISPRWTIETNQAQTSEVEVRFYAESPTRTRVELEHRRLDRHGPGWEAVSDGVDGAQGWPLYLDRYAALVKEVPDMPVTDTRSRLTISVDFTGRGIGKILVPSWMC